MAVSGWFIPVGNLFVPKQIADDVRHASGPTGRRGSMGRPGAMHAWWSVWVLAFLSWPLLYRPWFTEFDRERNSRGDRYSYDLEPIVWFNLGAQILLIAAAVAAFLFVRRLTAMRAARLAA